MKTRKERLNELLAEYEEQKKNLHAQTILWDDKWNAAPNPFVAWKEFKEDAAIRAPHMEAFHKAKNAYYEFKER